MLLRRTLNIDVHMSLCPSRRAEIFLGCAVLGKLTVIDLRKGQREMKITFCRVILKKLLKCIPVEGVRFNFIYDGTE